MLLFPEFLKQPWVPWPVWAAFLFFAGAWVVKTREDWKAGRLNVGRALLVGLSAVLFFFTPMLSNLDVAFQGLNTWHSFQYLAVVLYLNRYRSARGLIGSDVRRHDVDHGRQQGPAGRQLPAERDLIRDD